jgi:hypothetical protein
MPQRTYKAQKRRRVARGPTRALSRRQAHRHVKARKNPTNVHPPVSDDRIEAAVLEINRGRSLTATARAMGLSFSRLRQNLKQRRLIKRKSGRWVSNDNRLRRVQIITRGRQLALIVRGFVSASLAGAHFDAAGRFVRTNDISLLMPFEGKSIPAASGRRYPLETDPNALHRVAAIDQPAFHEIYRITSPT